MDSELSHFAAPTSEEPPNLLLGSFYLLPVDRNCAADLARCPASSKPCFGRLLRACHPGFGVTGRFVQSWRSRCR